MAWSTWCPSVDFEIVDGFNFVRVCTVSELYCKSCAMAIKKSLKFYSFDHCTIDFPDLNHFTDVL